MENIKNKLIIFLFVALVFPHSGISQGDLSNELSYEVNKIYKPLSITRETLVNAKTLTDLNKYYKPSWVKKYISVEVLARHNGSIQKAVSKNNNLSQEQKDIMNLADVGTDISVRVQYIPDNTLKHNHVKIIDFEFMVNPENEATYVKGEEALKQYIKNYAIDEIPSGSFNGYDLAAVKFTISEAGQIVDAQIVETSKDETIDKLLLETVRNMPNWSPAKYSNGIKVKQEFVLTVGNMESCVINLLNIRRD